ncbi:MAG: hypothetical protein RSE62_03670 [Citrobacter sp.]
MITERKPVLNKADDTPKEASVQVETAPAPKTLQSIAKYPAKVIANMTHAGVTYVPGTTVAFDSEDDRRYHENAKSVEVTD